MKTIEKTVEQLFFKSSGGDIYKWHHYLPIYEALFRKFVGTPVKVLEIGVLRGGSLKLWKEYFGADAQIYGIDIDPAAKQYETEGIKIFIGDQGDPDFLTNVLTEVGGFDIVIDDGAHTNFMVMSSLEALYPKTQHLYVVEDTHALYWWGGMYSLMRDIQYALAGKNNIWGVLKHLFRLLARLVSGNLSFMKFVQRKQDALTTDWHGFSRKPDQEVHSSADISRTTTSPFTAMTNGIRVYDSIVVFEKGAQQPRVAEIR